MSPDTLTQATFALQYAAPSPDEAGNTFFNVGYAAVPGADEIIALSLSKAQSSASGGFELVATGLGVRAQPDVRFQKVLADVNGASSASGVFGPSITVLANGTVAIGWQVATSNQAGDAQDAYAVLSGSGQSVAGGNLDISSFVAGLMEYQLNYQGPPDLYATPFGFNMEWNANSASNLDPPQQVSYEVQNFNLAGMPGARFSSTPPPGTGIIAFVPHAFTSAGPVSLQLTDNVIGVYNGEAFTSGATIPGEPPHAVTNEAAAMLVNGHAAVTWVDSGTAYVTVFNPSNDTFSATTGLDWGGVQDVHLVALPDGGFVVSWTNTLPPFGSPMNPPPRYEGEVFTADGVGGGVMTLSGDVAGIDSHGDLFTVSAVPFLGSTYIVTYAINGSGIGTPGNDIFNLSRAGDIVTGAGGNDTYRFAEVPWAGGHITDFNAGDLLDLTGLMSTTSDTGTDGFADGYLKITDNGLGSAQVWANYHLPGNDGWWLVETLDGVAPSTLQHTGDLITLGSSPGGGGATDVSTSDASYTAHASVKTITLTGSQQQHVDASATNGVAITSTDSGNVLIGGAGSDTFDLGRGGDWVTGGGGADTFAYAAIPWAGGAITDFNATQGDRVDVSGLLAQANFTGPDPFAASYLKFETDGGGNAQLWADYNLPGNDGWWLVATLDGVSTSGLHYANGVIT